MGRPHRAIVPLDVEATSTRIEALDGPAPAAPLPVALDAVPAQVEPEPALEPPQRSPARQHLADTIATVKALEIEVREAGAAIEPAREANWAAQRALDDAEAVLRDARPRDTYLPSPSPSPHSFWGSAEADDAARRARLAAEAPPISVADAKAAVQAAQDNLDSTRRLRQWHEDRLRTAEQRLQTRNGDIRSAVRLVLRADPAVLALAQECRRLKTRAEAARQAFSAILWGDSVQSGSPFYGWDHIALAHSSPEAMADWSVSRDWAAAIEALSSDPDAPLPAA